MGNAQVTGQLIQDLFEKHLKALSDETVVVSEPPNGGPRLGHFMGAVDGIGKRARENGTIARGVRVSRST